MTNLTAFEGKISIFDVAGKLMQSEKRRFNAGDVVENIAINQLNNGLFILKIESEKGSFEKRFVVQD